MMIINKVFITVFLLSVVGTVAGITFLALQSILYKYTSAEFMVKVNKVVILTFVIPVFYALGMLDHTNYYLSEYDMLVLVEQGTLADKLYAFRDTVGFEDKIALLWLAWLCSCCFMRFPTLSLHTRSGRVPRKSLAAHGGNSSTRFARVMDFRRSRSDSCPRQG